MTHWLPATALRFGWGVVGLAVLLAVVAVPALRGATVDAYPEFGPTTVEVQAEALGLSAVEVEQLITVPLEQDLLNGVPFVERVTSRSIPGLASVELVFEDGTDLYRARQLVTERMAQAHALPGVGTPPVMVQPRSSVNRVAVVSLRSNTVSPIQMSVLARWQLKPRLLGIAGVSNVSVFGQRDRQLQVQVDPARLAASGVTLTRLVETTGNALWFSPLSFVEASTPGTGGFVETPTQRLGVQHVSPLTTPEALASVAIEGTGPEQRPLRIGDVADVVEDHQVLVGDARLDDASALVVMVDRFPGADPVAVARDVEAALRSMAPGMTGITVDTSTYRPDAFLGEALRRTGLLAAIGLLLLALVIALLAGWRSMVVVLMALPTSLLAAVWVLHLRGAPLTSMTLLGLLAGLALVVDDSVRVTRNAAASATSGAEAARRSAVLLSTALVLVPAIPLLAVGGVPGAFAHGAAFAYVLAVLASLLVAATLTPVLAVALRVGASPGWSDKLMRWCADRGARVATHRAVVAVTVVGLLGGACAVAATAPSRSWLPFVADRTLLVDLRAAAGTSLPETTRITGLVAEELRGIDGVSSVVTTVGRALTSDRIVDVNSAQLWVALRADAQPDSARAAVSRLVHGYPGVDGQVHSYNADRLDAASEAVADDELVVRIYGSEYGELTTTAGEVSRMLSSVRGVVSPSVEAVATQPTARIEVDLDKARAFGLKPGDVRREAGTMVSGLLVGNLYEQQKIFDVVVWGEPHLRHSPEALADLRIDTPGGGQVRLGDVATVTVAPEPLAVAHDAVLRYVDVVARLTAGDRDAVVAEVSDRLQSVEMPFEYRAEVVEADSPGQVPGPLAWAVLAVLVILLLVAQAVTGSWRGAAVVVVGAGLGASGAVLVAPAVGGPATAGVLAGALAAAVLAARHCLGIVADLLARAAGRTPGTSTLSTVLRAHAPHVLVTTAATAGLVLPAALWTDDRVAFVHPAALALLAGLVTALLTTVVLVPGLLMIISRNRNRNRDQGQGPLVITLPNSSQDRVLSTVGPTTPEEK